MRANLMKKCCLSLFVVLAALLGMGMSSPSPNNLTMMVVPARYSVLQIAFDVMAKRPIVLVSYQGDARTENPVLYAWNGEKWLLITLEAFSEGRFIERLPRQTILVGGDDLLPPVLESAASWTPRVWRIPAVDTASLVNSVGKILRFRRSEWRWWAHRYNLDLTDINEMQRKDSWYDHPYVRPSRDVTYSDAEVRTYSGDDTADDETPAEATRWNEERTPVDPVPPKTSAGWKEENVAE